MADSKPARGYEEDFDSDSFLKYYVKTLKEQQRDGGVLPFLLDFLHDAFATGKYQADRLLDVGTGPSIRSVISASRHTKEIHLSDLTVRNREILQQWRDGLSYLEDIFDFINSKEKNSISPQQREDEVRNKVKKIHEIDLRRSGPLLESGGMYGIIIASLVLCSAAKNKAEFQTQLKRIIAMMEPGGYLIFVDVLGGTYYEVGNIRFPLCIIDREDMKNVFIENGLEILEWRETEIRKYYRKGLSDANGVIAMVAQKKK